MNDFNPASEKKLIYVSGQRLYEGDTVTVALHSQHPDDKRQPTIYLQGRLSFCTHVSPNDTMVEIIDICGNKIHALTKDILHPRKAQPSGHILHEHIPKKYAFRRITQALTGAFPA